MFSHIALIDVCSNSNLRLCKSLLIFVFYSHIKTIAKFDLPRAASLISNCFYREGQLRQRIGGVYIGPDNRFDDFLAGPNNRWNRVFTS